jgi:TolB protein
MRDTKQLLRETRDRIAPPPDVLGSFERRRHFQQQIRRGSAFVVGIVVALVGLGGWFAVGRDTARLPVNDRSGLGIFADVRGWITYGSPGYFEAKPVLPSGIWAVDPANPDEPAVQLSPEDGIPIAWSSDGSKLLINRPRDPRRAQSALVVLNPDGSETLVAVAQRYSLSGGSFTPDGSKVVYAAGLADSEWPSGIFVVDAEGGTPELLYAADERDYNRPGYPTPDIHQPSVFSPSLSPDGSSIAYVEGMGDWGNSVWVMNADGTDRRQIMGEEGPAIRPRGPWGLQWSPDGTRLALEGPQGIYVVNADGSALTRVAQGEEEIAPYWSPDGSRIAFQLYADATQAPYTKATLYSIAPDGSDVRSLGHVLQPKSDFGPWSYLGPWNPLAP